MNLAAMYFDGEGVFKDYVKSYLWLDLSESNGNQQARRDLAGLANLMTPQQIDEAKKLAQDCRVRKLKGCD
jgi:TPR repeat protein